MSTTHEFSFQTWAKTFQSKQTDYQSLQIVDQEDLLELRTCFENAVSAQTPKAPKTLSAYAAKKDRFEPNLTRSDFNAGLDHDSDRAILDRLFTMLDKTGDEVIHYQEFLVGIAPLVKVAFEMFDEECTGEINTKGFRFLINTITTVASYFGDPILNKKDVVMLINDIMESHDTIEYTKAIPRIAEHPIVENYVNQNDGAL
ncbi:hypothetical protein THRCLA_07281 [Thraustotheca clavata]|uniref:EF-hand domain-containing protein n=1 Tax=Thraustotheca clavata TaxID=74557 RepID=A0A1V9ZER8_9STRA|nr:hypothetical protein THRCLA_07281 [Thraustotheca clavata]